MNKYNLSVEVTLSKDQVLKIDTDNRLESYSKNGLKDVKLKIKELVVAKYKGRPFHMIVESIKSDVICILTDAIDHDFIYIEDNRMSTQEATTILDDFAIRNKAVRLILMEALKGLSKQYDGIFNVAISNTSKRQQPTHLYNYVMEQGRRMNIGMRRDHYIETFNGRDVYRIGFYVKHDKDSFE